MELGAFSWEFHARPCSTWDCVEITHMRPRLWWTQPCLPGFVIEMHWPSPPWCTTSPVPQAKPRKTTPHLIRSVSKKLSESLLTRFCQVLPFEALVAYPKKHRLWFWALEGAKHKNCWIASCGSVEERYRLGSCETVLNSFQSVTVISAFARKNARCFKKVSEVGKSGFCCLYNLSYSA